jgi:proline iminopeptidase
MKQTLIFLLILSTTLFLKGQALYIKTYGDNTNKPIIFVHGGPGSNSTLFESTTAQNLANRGFFIIIYDRRGEGRSIDSTATFTYQEAFDDLNNIYKTYNIEKANIIGHSFGGLLATLYMDKYPEKVKSLIFAGALFSQQETYDHILKSVKEIYKSNNDTFMLK